MCPLAVKSRKMPEQLGLVKLTEATLQFAYPFALPPGVPADRVAMFRKAFMATMRDPAYKNQVLKSKLEYSPKSGEEVQAIIDGLTKLSPQIIGRYKAIIESAKLGG